MQVGNAASRQWQKPKTAARWLEAKACADDEESVKHWLSSSASRRNRKAVLAYKGSDGFTPLHFAARHGSEKVTALLLEAGAQANAKDSYGKTPLHYAQIYQHSRVVTLLPSQESPPLADS